MKIKDGKQESGQPTVGLTLDILGDCVPCAGSQLKNPLSCYCLTIVSSESLAKGMGTKYLFCLPGLYLTAYFANNEVLPPFFDGVCLCYIVWSILID